MPGLTFVAYQKGISPQDKSLLLQSFSSILYTDKYKLNIHVDDKYYLLGTSAYDGYPIRLYENDDFIIFQEGELFGLDKSKTSLALGDLASHLFGDWQKARNYVSDWIEKIDGDFVVFLISKSLNSVIILNDLLGRLPIYFHCTSDSIILSRDLSFVSTFGKIKRLDRMGLAQYLLLGYPLGERTLLEGVSRLKPASLIRIDFNNFEIKITNCHQLNFGNNYLEDKSIRQNAENLASSFSEACRRRHIKHRDNILSLSGGLDSRSVAACLCLNNIRFAGVTRSTGDRKSTLDAKYAREVAELLRFDWALFHIHPPKGYDVLKLMKLKFGLNYLAMSFIIPFLEKIQEIYGTSIIYWTGDGGDKFIPDIRPPTKFNKMTDLINHIMIDGGIFSLKQVSYITKLEEEDILNEIENRMLSYPERELAHKHTHFLIYERAFKFLFEGEDRNRCYFWSVSPFYSSDFIKRAVSIPYEQKFGYKLYHSFIELLSTELTKIDDPNHKLVEVLNGNKTKILRKKLKANIPLWMKKSAKRYITRKPGNKYSEIMNRQILHCKPIREYVDVDIVRKSLGSLSLVETQTLFTITSVIELLEDGGSSIMEFYEKEII